MKSSKNQKTIEWHVNKEGLSNEVISDLMTKLTSTEKYLGVFPWTSLPETKILRAANGQKILGRKGKISGNRNLSFIINVGNHFVCVVITPQSVLYIDSFASTITQPEILRLFSRLEKSHRTLFRNRRQIQSFQSAHCGLYAALFTLWYLCAKKHRMKLRFKRENLLDNDELCIRYLKQFVQIMK